MKTRVIKILSIGLVTLVLCFGLRPTPVWANINFVSNNAQIFDSFIRTELYFGMNMPNNEKVSEESWKKFLTDQVTPRFPEGLTVLQGFGQFRDASGRIIEEESRVLILLYPKKLGRANNSKIEEIRAAYKKLFLQESVLRLDFRQSVKVSF